MLHMIHITLISIQFFEIAFVDSVNQRIQGLIIHRVIRCYANGLSPQIWTLLDVSVLHAGLQQIL